MSKTQADLNALAEQLNASDDFIVLRRMGMLKDAEKGAGPFAKVILLDTESTGLSPSEDKLIEVAALAIEVEVHTGRFVRVLGKFESLEDPGFPLEPNTIALTGLTDKDLSGKKFNVAGLTAFLKGADLVIAHSAAHDRPFFEARFPKLSDMAWGCSLSQVDWIGAGMGSSKLEFLLFKLGMFFKGHRALIDCVALGHVVIGSVLPSGNTVLQHLIDRSLKSDFRIYANGAPFDQKDRLKANGYYWDGDRKLWNKVVDEDGLDAECDWLHAEIYGKKSARVQLEILTSRGRFSHNPSEDSIKREWRSIGPQGDSPATTTGRAGRFSGSGRY
jgi:DNA polymerase III subunit epsilon